MHEKLKTTKKLMENDNTRMSKSLEVFFGELILQELEAQVTPKFNSLDEKHNKILKQIDELDDKIIEIQHHQASSRRHKEEKITPVPDISDLKLKKQCDKLETRFDEFEPKLDRFESRINILEKQHKEIKDDIKNAQNVSLASIGNESNQPAPKSKRKKGIIQEEKPAIINHNENKNTMGML